MGNQKIKKYKKINEFINSDRTGKNLQGLGLGLSIVGKIVNEMNVA